MEEQIGAWVGAVLGVIAGSLFWTWLNSKLFGKLLKMPRVPAVWWGYSLAVVFAIFATQAWGFRLTSAAGFVFFGFLWALLLARKAATTARKLGEDKAISEGSKPILDVSDGEFDTDPLDRQRPIVTGAVAQKCASRACPNCRTLNEDDAAYCNSCGMSLDRIVCNSCKTQNPMGSLFCKNCGSQIA